jgi:hypothetical protein
MNTEKPKEASIVQQEKTIISPSIFLLAKSERINREIK